MSIDAAPPFLHASQHAPGGTDPIATLALGNRVSMIGDSITIGNSNFTGTNRLRGDKDPLNWASLLSNGRINYQVNAGVSGNTTAQMLARLQTDIVAPGCDVCVVLAGTNDAGTGVTVASFAASITAIVAALRTAGIKPVLCTIPPQPTTPTLNPTRRRLWDSYNHWLTVYAARNAVPLVLVDRALMDATTGGYLSAYDSGDGIHPTAAGARVIGQAIVDTVALLLPVWTPPLPTFQTTDALNLLLSPMFLTDVSSAGQTAGDGVADEWTKTGNAVASLVTDAAILGKWQRLADTVNEFSQITPRVNVTTGFVVGDKLAFCGRVQVDGVLGQHNVGFGFNGSGYNVRPLSGFTVPVPSSVFYMEMVVPAATTSINASMSMQSGTSIDMRLAQLRIVNLTALGL